VAQATQAEADGKVFLEFPAAGDLGKKQRKFRE
jgi:hypothetical protein